MLRRAQYIPELDGLRGIAVLLVLWAHSGLFLKTPVLGWLRTTFPPGNVGVDIFFALSGFLITRILLVDRARELPLRYFLVRRFLRIFPIYYLLLVIVAFWRPGPDIKWCAAYLSNFFFAFHPKSTTALYHTWSLAVEEHFYLFWPVLVYLLVPRVSRRVAAYVLISGSIVAGVLTMLFVEPTYAKALVQLGTPYKMSSLLAGALMAYSEQFVRARPRRMLMIAAIGAPLGIWLIGAIDFHGWKFWGAYLRTVGTSVFGSSLVLAGVATAGAGNLAVATLRNSVLRWVGRISYGLYLYHVPIYVKLGLYRGRPMELPAWKILLGMLIAFAVATISFYVIERPILSFKDRFASKRRETPAPASVAAV